MKGLRVYRMSVWTIGDFSEDGVPIEVERDVYQGMDAILADEKAVVRGKQGRVWRHFPVRNITSVRFD